MSPQKGFTFLEVVMALLVVGVGTAALLGALTQSDRNAIKAKAWAREETRATEILFSRLDHLEHLRVPEARRQALAAAGTDPVLGAWQWEAVREDAQPALSVGWYRVRLTWTDPSGAREAVTHAALRIP